MLTIEELNEMKQTDIRTVDISQLVDLQEIDIDEKASVKSRAAQYIEAVHNPFLVKIGGYVVKFSYAEEGAGIEERMFRYISAMAGIHNGAGA